MNPLDVELKSLPLCSLAAEAQEKLNPALEGRSMRNLLDKLQLFPSETNGMVFGWDRPALGLTPRQEYLEGDWSCSYCTGGAQVPSFKLPGE